MSNWTCYYIIAFHHSTNLAIWQNTITLKRWHKLFHCIGKGAHNEYKNYRPITLLSVTGKVFGHVLLARLQSLLDKVHQPQQSDFTNSRSTLDAILTLWLFSEIHREYCKPLNIVYIDLKAAFDSVDKEALWKALTGIRVPNILLDLAQKLHHVTTSRVRLPSW